MRFYKVMRQDILSHTVYYLNKRGDIFWQKSTPQALNFWESAQIFHA